MPQLIALRQMGAALMAAQMLALPSFAQISPQQLWAIWQSGVQGAGQTLIAARETPEGNVLRLRDVTLAAVSGGALLQSNLDEIVMQDQGDGSVLVAFPAEFPMQITLPPDVVGGTEVQMDLRISQQDMRLVASGTPSALRHALTAAQINVRLDQITGAPDLTFDATLSAVSGDYLIYPDAGGAASTGSTTMQGFALAAVGTDQAEGTEMRLTAAMQGVKLDSSGALLAALMAALAPQQAAGVLAGQSAATSQSAQFEAEFTQASGRTTLSGTAGPATVTRSIEGDMMDYSAQQQALRVVINTPDFPFGDLTFDLAQMGVDLKAPLADDIGVQPFAMRLNLDSLDVPPQLWALFDPMASLPRAPATLTIALDGEADTSTQQDLQDQLQSMTLSEFRLRLAGAEINATGFSRFSPSPDGLPNPTAQIDLNLLGVNGLMGQLVQGQILAPEMLTFPRMMLAMLATPAADGSDSYQSQIEIRDRAIFANGQMLHQME